MRFDKEGQPTAVPTCHYTIGVLCEKPTEAKCEKYGWNPEVEKRRKEKLRNMYDVDAPKV